MCINAKQTAPPASVTIIGGGLAGSEAALQLADWGISVTLYEMKPVHFSPAHKNSDLAELVCSNSFKSKKPETAHGLLKDELKVLGSHLIAIAQECQIPGGNALVIDRDRFSRRVTERVERNLNIAVCREAVQRVPENGTVIVATGPLTSGALYTDLQRYLSDDNLFFFDAISPIVDGETLDQKKLFWANRYEETAGDYLNVPLTADEYYTFVRVLQSGKTYQPKAFDATKLFQGCQPIEDIALSGERSLAFGPMKPVGLVDPRDGKQPFAVVQLRKEDDHGKMLNMVGFQTRLTIPEQKRIFRMLPGFETAEFYRYGSIHRNVYINAPVVLTSDLSLQANANIYIAGQLSGCEGYVESLATGLLAALAIRQRLEGIPFTLPPRTTALGGLVHQIVFGAKERYTPMNVNYGLITTVGPSKGRANRLRIYDQAIKAITQWRDTLV